VFSSLALGSGDYVGAGYPEPFMVLVACFQDGEQPRTNRIGLAELLEKP
jgi:hypothetical protein